MNQNVINIIIYDDDCVLCNKSIRLVLNHDKRKRIWVTHPGSNWFRGQEIVSAELIKNTLVYVRNNNEIYIKSGAVLRICNDLGGFWKIFNVFYLIPEVLRNWMYDLIAKHRCLIFKSRNQCSISKDFQSFNVLA